MRNRKRPPIARAISKLISAESACPRCRYPFGLGANRKTGVVMRARAAKLARAGLSAPKIRTLKAIAKAVDRGELDLPALVTKPADEAHAVLTAVHGIGPWTADIYLLFCLGHADAWPAGDLALQEATRLLLALKTRPSVKEMGGLAEAWRPWRGAAACMLWAYYRAAKQRDGAPIAEAMASNG